MKITAAPDTRRSTQLSASETAQALRLYFDEEQSMNDLIRTFGRTYKVIRKALVASGRALRSGIEARRLANAQARAIPIPPKEDLQRMYLEEGRTFKEIGARFGASITTVHKWLRAMSIHKPTKKGKPRET